MTNKNSSYDFEVNQTKIKGDCQSGRKVVPHDSNSDFPLVYSYSIWLRLNFGIGHKKLALAGGKWLLSIINVVSSNSYTSLVHKGGNGPCVALYEHLRNKI